MKTRVRHTCGRAIGVQVHEFGPVYIGVWRELNCLQAIQRCPGCGTSLARAEAAGELRADPCPDLDNR